jgi:hypothetical protein
MPYYQGDAAMLSRLLIFVGVLATIAGVVFALQGFGVLGGSVMSGTSLWATLGPIIALAGLIAIGAGLRLRRASSAARG